MSGEFVNWWTMSPYWWLKTGKVYVHSVIIEDGRLDYFYVDDVEAVRPVISLKSCVQWDEGNGTSATPYKVRINESCISAEN